MTDQTANKTPITFKQVEVQWPEQPALAMYANNLAIQYDGKAFHLIFAQVLAPLVLRKTEEEVRQRYEEISSVSAIPVARLVISVEDVRNMLHNIQDQLNKVDALIKP